MAMKSIRAFLKLIRIGPSLFAAVNVLIAGVLAGDLRGFQIEYVAAFFIIFFTAVGAFAFNDFYDYESDRENERQDRPLVLGLLSKRIALIAGITAFALVVLLSFFLNPRAMTLVLVSLPLFYLYSLRLKRILIVKNMTIAYAYVASIFLGSLVSDGVLEPLIIYFAVMGFIVGMAFEIMLDAGDVEGDRKVGTRTLATRFGTRTAAKISVVLYAVIMVMDPLPFFISLDVRLFRDFVFLIFILVPVIAYAFLSWSLMKNQSTEHIQKLGSRTFLIMQVGSAAYLVGVLV